MNMLKKLMPLIISAFAFIFLLPANARAEEPDFTYTIINGEATIIGFTGEPEKLDIPAVIEGCPVTEIRDNAFFNCGSLREITLPESLKIMGHHCFYACTSLERIVLPVSLEEIGMGCFCGCVELSSVTISGNLTVLPDSCFRSCTSLEKIIIPQNIIEIEKYCFSGCTALKRVSLSGRLREIGCYAFFMCNSLEELYIPPSVKALGTESVGFIPDPNGAVPPSANGFTVFGERGSAAEAYAKSNDIAFSESVETVQAMAFRNNGEIRPPIAAKLMIGGIIIFILSLAAIISSRKKDQ